MLKPFWRTRHYVGFAQMQQPDIHEVQSVGILAVVDEVENPCRVVVVGQRQLDEDGVHFVIAVAVLCPIIIRYVKTSSGVYCSN